MVWYHGEMPPREKDMTAHAAADGEDEDEKEATALVRLIAVIDLCLGRLFAASRRNRMQSLPLHFEN